MSMWATDVQLQSCPRTGCTWQLQAVQLTTKNWDFLPAGEFWQHIPNRCIAATYYCLSADHSLLPMYTFVATRDVNSWPQITMFLGGVPTGNFLSKNYRVLWSRTHREQRWSLLQFLERCRSSRYYTRKKNWPEWRVRATLSLLRHWLPLQSRDMFYALCDTNIYLFITVGLTRAKVDKIIAKSDHIEQKLLELNLRLVHSIALQHQGMGLELDDLVYEGMA